MKPHTLAHLSDLHLGGAPRWEAATSALVQALIDEEIDHVVVTGDITNRGLLPELSRFQRIFSRLELDGRVTVVPGNHDRLGDDVAQELMRGRVQTVTRPGMYIVRIDSTGPHNRYVFAGHGELSLGDLEDIDRALDAAPAGALVVALLHHHPVPLPEEWPIEKLAKWVGLPFTAELHCGRTLIERLRGRCDLVLHGHRHTPSVFEFDTGAARPLSLYNAGSSAQLGRARVFSHADGRLCREPLWMVADAARVAA